jgi:hypothetical protein
VSRHLLFVTALCGLRPPEILAGESPEPKQNLRLDIEQVAFDRVGPRVRKR